MTDRTPIKEGYAKMLTDAPTPWNQAHDLAVVKDANGITVSFALHAPRIVRAVNGYYAQVDMLERVQKSIIAATGPSAGPSETHKLLMLAIEAGDLVKQVREGK